MQYSEVLLIEQLADKIDESTKAAMLWVAPDEGGLLACVSGESPEILKIYKAIFLGILPLASEQGWLS